MRTRRLALLAGVTLVYVAAGRLGLSLAFTHSSATAVWPPAGIALGALVVFGWNVWPAITVGALLVNLGTTADLPSSAGIAAGNTLEALAGVWLLHRLAGGREAVRSADGVFRLAYLVAPLASAVGATLGVASLALSGLAAAQALGSIWITWWLGDAVGVVVVAPFVILWSERGRVVWTPGRRIEAALLLATLLVTSLVVFRGLVPAVARGVPLAFAVLPAVMWVAFRFSERETVSAVAVLAAIANWGTLDRFGPFGGFPPETSLPLLQAFIGVLTVAMLAAAAEVANRRASDASLSRLNRELEAAVALRTEQLLKTQARLVEAQEVAHIGSWEWDIERNTIWWSNELYRIYGIDPRTFDASYEAFLRTVHPDDRALVDTRVRAALADHQPFAYEHRIIRPNGSVRRLHGQGRVIADEKQRAIRMLGTGQDITEQHLAQEERAQFAHEQAARREAEAANDAKDQFLALLSHELRTPVNAVLGWAHLLVQGRLDEPAREKAIATIYRNATLQTRLVSDLLDASRIRTGTMHLAVRTMELGAAVEEAVESVRPMAMSKSVRVVTELQPATMVGDPQRLGQVARNLLLNAVKFAYPGGLVLLTLAVDDTHATMSVADDGPGIAPDFLPHLFEQFRQADPSITRENQGLGLGLAIVREIVTLHGGTVAAANRTESRGAIFTVRLPTAGPRGGTDAEAAPAVQEG